MYRVELPGCLTTLLILFLAYLFLKEFWWVFVGIAIVLVVAYYARLIYLTIVQKQQESKQNYNPQMGEVYKVCPFCNATVKVTEVTCPNCKRSLN